MRALLLATILVGGCKHVDVYARPAALAKHRAELATKGYARVEVEQGGTFAVDASAPVVVTIPGNERSYAWGLVRRGTPNRTIDTTVGSLVANCSPDATGPDCLAARVPAEPLRVGTRRELSGTLFAIGVFGALATVVGTACLAICDDPTPAAYVGTALGGITLVYPLMTTAF